MVTNRLPKTTSRRTGFRYGAVMNIPRNGSTLSNCLLVTAGAAVGACVTILLHSPAENAAALDQNATASLAKHAPAAKPSGDRSTPAADARSRSLEELSALPASAAKSQALTELGHQLATKDPQAAMAAAQSIPGDADRLDFLRGAMAAWSLTDPRGSLDYARTHLPNGQAQSESIRVAIDSWSARDPRAAFVWTEENLSGPLKEEALGTFAQSWARTAPDKAAAWFLETGSTSQTLLNNLVTGWAAVDPAAAISWSAQLTQPGNQRVGLVTAIGELARQNPAAAADAALPYLTDAPPSSASSIAGSAPEGARRSIPDLPTILADIWGTSDPAAAAKWVSELPAGASRTEAASTLATVWAASDIQSAVKWSEGFSDPEMRATIVEHLATTWGAIEPDKAIAWLNTQPPEIAANGIRGAYNSWAATDPAGMQDWLGQLPPGLGTDQARGSLADVLSGTDPLAALDLARNMFSPSTQADALNRYYRSWQRQSPAEANEWLTAEWATLPPQARQRMTKN
ncbi:MAG: hypothetical protein JWL81_926, partial [Verrucomicrobiales bacterium]|nr:hypothetical protein [Verrucomicrobiales bacterium]